MAPKETGLRRIGAGPRHHYLHVTKDDYVASVFPIGGNWAAPLKGWAWSVPAQAWTPHVNTYETPVATAEEAKAAAMAYIKKHRPKDTP